MSFSTAVPISNTPPSIDFGLIPQPTPTRLQDVSDQTSTSEEFRGRSRTTLGRSWEVEKTINVRSRSLPPGPKSESLSSPLPERSTTRSRSPSPSPDGSPTRSRSPSPLPNSMLLDDPTSQTNPPGTSSSNPQENVPPNRVPNHPPVDPTAVNTPVNPLDAAEKKKNEEVARKDRKALIGAVCSAALIAFSVIAIAFSIASLMTATWIWFAISITGAAGSGVGGAFLAHKSCFVSPTT
jgi:hypothetical protein